MDSRIVLLVVLLLIAVAIWSIVVIGNKTLANEAANCLVEAAGELLLVHEGEVKQLDRKVLRQLSLSQLLPYSKYHLIDGFVAELAQFLAGHDEVKLAFQQLSLVVVRDRGGFGLMSTLVLEHIQEDFTSGEVGVVAASHVCKEHARRGAHVLLAALHDICVPFIVCLLVIPLIVEATACFARHIDLVLLLRVTLFGIVGLGGGACLLLVVSYLRIDNVLLTGRNGFIGGGS